MNVLQFSGGIDSLACLLLLANEPGLVVVTVQTDGSYEGTTTYLDFLEQRFSHLRFARVLSHRHIADFGHPVDVVPLRYTAYGQLCTGGDDVRYQDYFSCCNRAIWGPLDKISRELHPETIYRGQRDTDRQRAPIRDGFKDGSGVTIRFPIASWTRDDVVSYVMQQAPDLMPPGYERGERTSRDCWDCTAYLEDNRQRIANLPEQKHQFVMKLLNRWRDDVAEGMGD
jgi:3'-phosphoadenosine 5'-phosphosulfate sulfotransferase (PAPS reductase)/FAD synthetase